MQKIDSLKDNSIIMWSIHSINNLIVVFTVHSFNKLTFVISVYRKESSFNLGSAETKLLYTLHWILLDAADECILQAADNDGKIDNSPFSYLFPVTAITVTKASF